MKETIVKATRWKLGWELSLNSGGLTQVRTLARAEQQVRDYLDTVEPATDHSDWPITIIPDIGEVRSELEQAQLAVSSAKIAQVEAGQRMRGVVRQLRAEGLSIADTACILGVSKGRVSQLVN
ncbi:MAG: antitoxin HicB [Propionibacteriaceae bacterium]|nr:antitoxin HicB [Propionibacteriaceae bacterium]